VIELANIETLANLAEIFGAMTVIGGVVFALVQLREFRRQRRDVVTLDMMGAFQEPAFARAVRLIRQLPDAVSSSDLRNRGDEFEEAAILITTTFETIGLMVHERTASYRIARELTGGLAVVMWRKLARWMSETRIEQSQPNWAEWFQWLAERFEDSAREAPQKPAYQRAVDWLPRS
jgi:hypothetical protein